MMFQFRFLFCLYIFLPCFPLVNNKQKSTSSLLVQEVLSFCLEGILCSKERMTRHLRIFDFDEPSLNSTQSSTTISSTTSASLNSTQSSTTISSTTSASQSQSTTTIKDSSFQSSGTS